MASPTGTNGGPAADVSFFADFAVGDTASVHINLPVTLLQNELDAASF